jgi:hypothetical protein
MVAQSVLATGWTITGSEFKFQYGQEFSLFNLVEICSEAHRTSYSMGIRGSFSGGKVAGVRS